MKKTHAAVTGGGSPLKKYQNVMVGSRSLGMLFYFEWCQFFGAIPGALGMGLRRVFWPRLFGSCGRGCLFGGGIVLRHPGRIHLGNKVVISEGCVLDGRHQTSSAAITLGDNVMLANGVTLSCKNGTIRIGCNVGLNTGAIVQSTSDCPVVIGNDCVIGQQALVIGGGSYRIDRLDIPIRTQGIVDDGGVVLEEDVWLGGHVTVLGGVVMGRGSVAAAGAVVTRSVPVHGICMGAPARVVRSRSS